MMLACALGLLLTVLLIVSFGLLFTVGFYFRPSYSPLIKGRHRRSQPVTWPG